METDLISLIDMDGTLCDYESAMIHDLLSIECPKEPINDEFLSQENLNLHALEKHPYIKARMHLIKNQPNWWVNLKPIDSGMKVIDLLNSLGFRIHILTQGPANTSSAWTEKVIWCKKHLHHIDYDITITRDKGLVYGKVLVDDYPDYILRWSKWRPRGLVIMPSMPYNQHLKDHPNILSYDGSEASLEKADARLRDLKMKIKEG